MDSGPFRRNGSWAIGAGFNEDPQTMNIGSRGSPLAPLSPTFLLGDVAVLHEPRKLLDPRQLPQPMRGEPHHAAHVAARFHKRPQGHRREELHPLVVAAVGEPAELGGHHLDYLLFPHSVPASLAFAPNRAHASSPDSTTGRPGLTRGAPARGGPSLHLPLRSGGCGARIPSARPSAGPAPPA